MRSDVIKKGAPAAPNRSLLYALGYTKGSRHSYIAVRE